MAESEATKIQIVAPQAEQPQVILEDGRIAGTIHCSELHPAITESDLFQYFSGPTHTVIDVKLMRDAAGHSLGHGFITFQNDAQAKIALDNFNFTKIYGRVIRVSFARPKEKLVKSPRNRNANLYVKNLDAAIDARDLYQVFKTHGNITSVRVMEFIDGRSKGFGFVCFEKEEEAQSAIASLNGLVLKGQALHVSVATEKRNDKDNAASDDMKSDTSANGENKEGDQAGTEGNTTQGNAGKPHNNRSGNYRGRRGGGRGGRGGYHPRNYAQPPVGYGYIAPPQFVYYATENGVVPFPAYSPAAAVTGAYPVPTGQWAAGMPVSSSQPASGPAPAAAKTDSAATGSS